MNAYRNLKYLTQVRLLRSFVIDVIEKQYCLKIRQLKFIHHGENTTFKLLDNKGDSYQVRIHRYNYHSDKAILEEITWVNRLFNKGMDVPCPVHNKAGKFLSKEIFRFDDTSRQVVIFKWVKGRRILTYFPDHKFSQIGKTLAFLHKDTFNYKVKHRKYWGADGLVGKNKTYGKTKKIEWLTQKEEALLKRVTKTNLRLLRKYERNTNKVGLIHADIHSGNILMNKGEVCLIDFDDCGDGMHLYDIATTLYKPWRNYTLKKLPYKRYTEIQDYLLQAYSKIHNITQKDIEMIPVFLDTRVLTGIEWLNHVIDNPRLAKLAKPFTKFHLKRFKKELKL
mgnify:CR=1 FL=1